MEQQIIQLIGFSGLAIILAEKIPFIQGIKSKYKLYGELKFRYKAIDLIYNMFTKLINCAPCLSFWICLMVTNDLWLGTATYIITEVFVSFGMVKI